MDFNMILMYLIMILLNCKAKVSFDFWTKFTYFDQSGSWTGPAENLLSSSSQEESDTGLSYSNPQKESKF